MSSTTVRLSNVSFSRVHERGLRTCDFQACCNGPHLRTRPLLLPRLCQELRVCKHDAWYKFFADANCLALYMIWVGLARNTYIYNTNAMLPHDIIKLPKLRALEKSANIKKWNPSYSTISHAPHICNTFFVDFCHFQVTNTTPLTVARFYESLACCYLGHTEDRRLLDYQPLRGGVAMAAVRNAWQYHMMFSTTHQPTKAESCLITSIVYGLLFALPDVLIKNWTRVMKRSGIVMAPGAPEESPKKHKVCQRSLSHSQTQCQNL